MKQLIPASSLRRVANSASRLLAGNAAATTPSPAAATSLAGLRWQAYPNPFTTEVALDFTLPTAGPYSLAVYDATGRLLEQLPGGQAPAGEVQHLTWQASRHPNGLYLLRLRTAAGTRQLRLVKE